MSGFSPDWLDLREPADARARSRLLLAELLEHTGIEGLRITDLGCGTGATARALTGYLQRDCEWLLVDHDPALLAAAQQRLEGEIRFRIRRADLARELEAVLAHPADVITGSALLDLVSEDWLRRLVDAVPRTAVLYFALSYDGLEQWEPPHEAEADALAAFHRHQRGDKGFGPALGPDGVAVLATMLRERGYRVDLSPSPWQLTQADHRLIEALAEGAALAVSETGLLPEAVVAEWFAARCRARRVTIGHVDLLAIPPG